MTTTIIPPGSPALTQPPAAGVRPAVSGDSGPATGAPAPAADKGADQVRLTESARAMGEAARGTGAPVDSQRVDRIRQALADGSYKVDPQRIADRLISLEKQLG